MAIGPTKDRIIDPPEAAAPDLAALSAWAPELARTFVSLASDIALVIDGGGVIRTVAQSQNQPMAAAAQWVGRAWIDTVSGDTRAKVQHLLNEVVSTGIARRREVNHPVQSGADVPMAYTAIQLGRDGPVLAVGRDLRAIAAIQQRFIDSQQDMERGYWRARQAESRNRLLFQVATDAVMVVDPESLIILEVNHAVTRMLGRRGDSLIGKPASASFLDRSRVAVAELLANARGSGESGEIRARLLDSAAPVSVVATSFRSDESMRLLLRIRAADDVSPNAELSQTLARLVDDSHDAVVVTDSSGRILVANPSFLHLLRIGAEKEVKGIPLMDWLGEASPPTSSGDFDPPPRGALLSRVRKEGIVRGVTCRLRPVDGNAVQVDVSAALLTEGDQECLGFTIRVTPQAPTDHAALTTTMRADMDRLIARIGASDLPTMVHEAAALVEHHLIELALAKTAGDVDAAAGLLGVGRERIDRSSPSRGKS